MKLSAILAPMIEAGVPGHVILETVRAFEAAGADALEKRREADRARQSAKRDRDRLSRDSRDVTVPDVTAEPRALAGSNNLPSGEDIKTSPEGEAKSAADAAPLPVSQAFDDWDDLAARCGLSRIRDRGATRSRQMRALLAAHGLDGWREALTIVAQSPFLLGANDRGWKADIDFLLTPKKFARIREGTYERGAGPPPANVTPIRQASRIQDKLRSIANDQPPQRPFADAGAYLDLEATPSAGGRR